jgi:hypothetical protein
MAFQLVRAGQRSEFFRAMPEGVCSIDGAGAALFHKSDLELVDIADQAAILADPDTLRIAVRKPRADDDPAAIVRVTIITNKRGAPTGRAKIPVGATIRECGLTAKAARGRYDLATKDDLIIVALADAGRLGER